MDKRTVRGQVLPTRVGRVIVPNRVILEVVTADGMAPFSEDRGYFGRLAWRSLDIPIVSLEQIAGVTVPARGPRTTLAVLNAPAACDDLRCFALLATDLPSSRVFDNAALEEIHETQPPYSAMGVYMSDGLGFILNLEMVEAHLRSACGLSQAPPST